MKFNKKLFSQRFLLTYFLILVVIVASLLVFMAIRIVAQYYHLPPIVEMVTVEKSQIKPGLPKQLKIPSINVDVAIDYVGLTLDSAMDIEPNPDIVGWYMLGPRPGDSGSAVIAGHYGWTEKGPAIFNDIQTLKIGDELSVIDQQGVSFVFVVHKIKKYSPESDATAVFKSDDGKAHLNLVTCNGVWENDQQSYSERLVVFTDKK